MICTAGGRANKPIHRQHVAGSDVISSMYKILFLANMKGDVYLDVDHMRIILDEIQPTYIQHLSGR